MVNFRTISTSSPDPISHDPSSLVMPSQLIDSDIDSNYHPIKDDCESDNCLSDQYTKAVKRILGINTKRIN